MYCISILPTSSILNNCATLLTDGRVLTIENLQQRNEISDSLLHLEIHENKLHSLAGCFDNVEDYLDELELTEGQQTDVKDIAHKKGTQIGMTKALKLWRRLNPIIATYENLLILLLKLKKGDVACKCCDLIPKLLPGSPDAGTSNSRSQSMDEGIVHIHVYLYSQNVPPDILYNYV